MKLFFFVSHAGHAGAPLPHIVLSMEKLVYSSYKVVMLTLLAIYVRCLDFIVGVILLVFSYSYMYY